jgi:chromosome segregation ATPase
MHAAKDGHLPLVTGAVHPEVIALKKQALELSAHIQFVQTANVGLASLNDRLMIQHGMDQRLIAELNAKNVALHEEFVKMQKQLAEATASSYSARAEMGAVKQELVEVKNERNDIATELDGSKSLLTECNRQIDELTAQNETSQQRIDKLEAEIRLLKLTQVSPDSLPPVPSSIAAIWANAAMAAGQPAPTSASSEAEVGKF